MAADLFDSWFRIADRDRDGRVSGGEAVDFFQRANLNQDTLFKVWSLVAGDNAFLTKPQFYSALRLISLAQKSGGNLPEASARSTLIGVGPPLPPPTLNGLEQPQPQQWSGARQVMQGQPSAATPQQQPGAASPSFPPMQPAQAQHYGNMFTQMDKDRDGFVQGGDCFNAFMQWGLPKPTLKDVWQVVAGNEGRLNQQQFIQALYLMDQAKRGQAPPAQLPPGPFPPMAPTPSPSSQQQSTGAQPGPAGFSIADTQRAEYDVFSNELPLPDMPPKRSWQEPAPQPSAGSSVPAPSQAALGDQPPAQRQRLEDDTSQAKQAEQDLMKAQTETEMQAAQAREAAYQSALQDLTLFKSRTAAALLQAQERAAQATGQADAMQQQYESAWAGAEDSHRTGKRLLDSLTKAKARRAEMTTKLEELERDIAQLGQHSEEQVATEEVAAERLSEEVAAAEARKATLELRVTVVSEERQKLEGQLASLQGGVSEAEIALSQAQEGIAAVKDQLEAGDQAAATSNLQSLLKRSAALYTSLTELALAAAVDVPEEAVLSAGNAQASDEPPGPRILQWSDFLAAGAADWEDFEDEGFTVVDALPNEERYDPSPVSSRSRLSPSPSPHERAPSVTQRDPLPQPAELAFADTAISADLHASATKPLDMVPSSNGSQAGTPKAQAGTSKVQTAPAGSMDFPPPSPVAAQPASSAISSEDNWAAF